MTKPPVWERGALHAAEPYVDAAPVDRRASRWGVSEQCTSATAAGSQQVNASMGVRSRSPHAARGENVASAGGSARTAARMPAPRPGSSGGATPRTASMASGQRRVNSASARCGHDGDVVGDQLGMSGSGGGRRGMSSPEGLGADWTAEVWRVVDASNVAEQQWRGVSR